MSAAKQWSAFQSRLGFLSGIRSLKLTLSEAWMGSFYHVGGRELYLPDPESWGLSRPRTPT